LRTGSWRESPSGSERAARAGNGRCRLPRAAAARVRRFRRRSGRGSCPRFTTAALLRRVGSTARGASSRSCDRSAGANVPGSPESEESLMADDLENLRKRVLEFIEAVRSQASSVGHPGTAQIGAAARTKTPLQELYEKCLAELTENERDALDLAYSTSRLVQSRAHGSPASRRAFFMTVGSRSPRAGNAEPSGSDASAR
jgi:hypothetical protein